MKATEQHYPVVPFTILHKAVLTFESVDEILNNLNWYCFFLCYTSWFSLSYLRPWMKSQMKAYREVLSFVAAAMYVLTFWQYQNRYFQFESGTVQECLGYKLPRFCLDLRLLRRHTQASH